MLLRLLGIGLLMTACGGGGEPQINNLEDQIATVGTQLEVRIDGSDPDGDALTYGVKADVSLQGEAMLTQDPSGQGVFRWTPLAEDVGVHAFDFTASDSSNTTTVTIQIDVRSAVGAVPIFRRPLGSGTVINSGACAMVDILIEDQDTANVTITDAAPIAGSTLNIIDGTSATYEWCPTAPQIAQQDRYTLILSADDGENAPTLKEYVLVLKTGTGTIVINEVDYDNVGTDAKEFIELFNPGSASVALAGLAVVLVNGADGTVYDTIDLSSEGELAGGQYLVIAGAGVTVPGSAKHINPLWSTNQIQNGAPDGIALVDTVTAMLLDAVSYEGSITMATIEGFATPVSLVEGMAIPATLVDSSSVEKSLCRSPNGSDTNQGATDWILCSVPTPGSANAP
jgi:Lamin Tail Domain/Bacterial Ig domain